MSAQKIFPGDVYGAWTVLGYAGYWPGTRIHAWRVRCSCGKEAVRRERELVDDISTSCGHVGRQLLTHQGETLPLSAWAERLGITPQGLRGRLARHTVEEALALPPRRRGITYRGETLPIAEWARRLGLTESAIHSRLADGWSEEDALATPLLKDSTRKPLSYSGRQQTLAAWAAELGIARSTLCDRLKRGWPLSVAFTAPEPPPAAPLSEEQRSALRAWRAESTQAEVSRACGIPKESLKRALSGLPVTRKTAAKIRVALAARGDHSDRRNP